MFDNNGLAVYNRGMAKSIRLRAFGKVNLSLNITGKNAKSGLHELDSVMMSVDVFDTVTVTERTDGDICVAFVNADIDGQNNTAYKAAKAVHDVIGGCGYDIWIEKGIPIGAGLGGSSADGAAVLRAFDLFYRLPDKLDMRALALSIGSDVPFMLTGGLARVTGTGEDMFFMENKLSMFAIGLMSDSVSTAAAYAEFDRLYGGGKYCPTDNDKLCELLLAGDERAVHYLGNALFEPAVNLCPSIKDNADMLKFLGADVNLTGSGGMVMGYFTDIKMLADCAMGLHGKDYYPMSSTKTGILHEWIER